MLSSVQADSRDPVNILAYRWRDTGSQMKTTQHKRRRDSSRSIKPYEDVNEGQTIRTFLEFCCQVKVWGTKKKLKEKQERPIIC